MKVPILLAFISFICYTAKAQKDTTGLNLPVRDGQLVYEEVIQIENKLQKELYQNASQWFVDFFKSSKDVIQNKDMEQGRIVGKGIVYNQIKIIGMQAQFPNLLTIQVDCKDYKFKYKIYDMTLSTETEYLKGFGTLKGRTFTAEDLIGNLTGSRNKVLTKSASRKTLESIKAMVSYIAESLTKAMHANNSF